MNVTRHTILCVRLLACAVLLSSVGGAGSADETTPGDAEAEVATESTAAPDPAPEVPETGETETPADPAEASERTSGIEEITVTARRREENLQETPISITAFSESALEDRAMRDLTELTNYTPNLRFTASGGQSANAQVYIRGIGQSEGTINAEPRVGIYLDDVYQARPLGSILSIVDLQRVEVLRGPQGTLYGKNAIGGAINIISNRPGPEYSVRGEIGYGNLNQFLAKLTANAPVDIAGLGDKLFLRGSVFYERRDGYLWDLNLEEEFASNKVLGGRAAIRYLPIDTLDLQISFSQTKQPRKSLRGECELVAGMEDSDFMQAVQHPVGIGAVGGDFIEECNVSHEYLISTNVPNKDRIDTQKIYGHLSWDTPEIPALGSLTVESITAYQSLVQNFNFDWDSTALSLISSMIPDLGIGQFSQELRTHGSAWDERVHWTLGAFYLRETSWGPMTHTLGVIPDFEFQDDAGIFPLAGTIDEQSDFTHQTAAGYLFGGWDPIERLHLNLGFRFGWESKDLYKYREIDISGYLGGWNPLPVEDGQYNIFGAIFIPAFTEASVTNSWTAPTGNFNVTYDITDDVHIYTGYQRGFSSGGFNYIGDDENETPNAFDPETLDGVELGLKSTWFDRRLVVNATYFWNYYHDMQVRLWEAATQGVDEQLFGARNVVANAGNAWIQGAELEVTYQPVEGLMLMGNLGLTFTHYYDFELLNVEKTKDASVNFNPDGSRIIVEVYDDLSDNAWANTPKINFGLLASYTWVVDDGFEITPAVDYAYQSKVYFDVTNTKELSQDAFGLLGARLTFEILRSNTTLMLWAKNLLDERYLIGGFSLGSYVSRYWAAPRTFGFTITQSFESD
jgi:iron complex outermembrane receptor protein